MSSRQPFFSSSVGSKILVGVAGLGLFAYLIVHLAGNLLVYLGRDAFNQYSYTLESNPLVYVAEAGLLLFFVVHIWKAVALTLAGQRARPVRYQLKKRAGYTSRKSLASTTMIVSGLFLLVFVPIHVKMFKFGTEYATAHPGVRDLYRVEMENFSHPGWVVFYLIAMVVVGFHLWHGISSGFQTLGADTPRMRPVLRMFGWIMAVVIAVGFITIPLWAFFFGGRS
jgi:succinate dehydrogenase / fumarate reductase cytochrome b subunit